MESRVSATVICLVYLLASATWAGAIDNPGDVTPFAKEVDGGIVLSVQLNGNGPFRFRLDTGASRTVVSESVAERLQLPAAGRSRALTPTGHTIRRLALLDAVRAGCAAASRLDVLVVPDADLDPAERVDGLIGQDVLGELVYTLDYDRHQLRCHQGDAADLAGTRLRLDITDGRALVSLPLRQGGDLALQLVPDSGADRLVLFPRRGTAAVLVTPLDTVMLRSVAGQRLARRVLVQGLEVGGRRLGDHEGVLLDRGSGDDALGDGLLPLHLFARATFNGPGGYLILAHRR